MELLKVVQKYNNLVIDSLFLTIYKLCIADCIQEVNLKPGSRWEQKSISFAILLKMYIFSKDTSIEQSES